MNDSVLRRFARDQWVRLHGTPRITVLAGTEHARRLWRHWLAVGDLEGTLLDNDFDRAVREAFAIALASPAQPIAVLAPADAIRRWRHGRGDRLAAMVDEGLLVVANPPPTGAAPVSGAPVASAGAQIDAPTGDDGALFDARSAAEAALFEALEATPATVGRFQLNESLSVRFGSRAAEVDLLSRDDRIAIEIDGIHHFADPDCYRRDRRKDLMMQMQGLFVIRLLAEDVLRDPRDAVGAVCQALSYRIGQ